MWCSEYLEAGVVKNVRVEHLLEQASCSSAASLGSQCSRALASRGTVGYVVSQPHLVLPLLDGRVQSGSSEECQTLWFCPNWNRATAHATAHSCVAGRPPVVGPYDPPLSMSVTHDGLLVFVPAGDRGRIVTIEGLATKGLAFAGATEAGPNVRVAAGRARLTPGRRVAIGFLHLHTDLTRTARRTRPLIDSAAVDGSAVVVG